MQEAMDRMAATESNIRESLATTLLVAAALCGGSAAHARKDNNGAEALAVDLSSVGQDRRVLVLSLPFGLACPDLDALATEAIAWWNGTAPGAGERETPGPVAIGKEAEQDAAPTDDRSISRDRAETSADEERGAIGDMIALCRSIIDNFDGPVSFVHLARRLRDEGLAGRVTEGIRGGIVAGLDRLSGGSLDAGNLFFWPLGHEPADMSPWRNRGLEWGDVALPEKLGLLRDVRDSVGNDIHMQADEVKKRTGVGRKTEAFMKEIQDLRAHLDRIEGRSGGDQGNRPDGSSQSQSDREDAWDGPAAREEARHVQTVQEEARQSWNGRVHDDRMDASAEADTQAHGEAVSKGDPASPRDPAISVTDRMPALQETPMPAATEGRQAPQPAAIGASHLPSRGPIPPMSPAGPRDSSTRLPPPPGPRFPASRN